MAPVVALVVPVEAPALVPAATSPSSFGAQIHLFTSFPGVTNSLLYEGQAALDRGLRAEWGVGADL